MYRFGQLFRFFNRNKCYVMADARDNSITFSRQLCKEMDVFNLRDSKVIVFSLKGDGQKRYGFMINPEVEKETQLSDIQYNSKYRCVGIESLTPTVNRIFYDYGLPADSKCYLSVKHRQTGNGTDFYEILRPGN